jgi:uncharacterized protein YcfL
MKLAIRTAIALGILVVCASADARKPEDVFKGQIIILKKPLPLRFKSDAHFIAEVKKNQIDQVWPQTKEEKSWKIEYAAFFAQPLNDVQAEAKFFDITNKAKKPRFVTSDSQYTSKRGDRVLFNSIVVEKGEELFQINHKYLMRLESKHKIIATATFWLRGKGPHYSGKVTFTEEDAKKKGDDE